MKSSSLDHLNWRYAVKKFDASKKLSPEELHEILEVLRLAPSSFGLQPWKFIAIENLELRKKLQPHCWNQSQVTEASHLIVLCSLRSLDETYVKNFISQVTETRSLAPETLQGYQKVILGFLHKLTPQAQKEWMKNQIYLALGMLLSECAHRRIDTCPMEGFEPGKVDEVLDLKRQNLQSVVLCPVGYRSPDDKHAQLKKVRFQRDQVVIIQ